MTGTLPAVAVGAGGHPSSGMSMGVSPGCGWSRDGSRVSQDRDGLRQIQSRATRRSLRYKMIGPTHKVRYCLPTNWAFDTTGYTSAYRSSYTTAYTKPRRCPDGRCHRESEGRRW